MLFYEITCYVVLKTKQKQVSFRIAAPLGNLGFVPWEKFKFHFIDF